MKAYSNVTIKNWSLEDRPREKLLNSGIHSLSNAELIALIIGSGTRKMNAVELSRNILASVKNDLQELGKLSIDDMVRIRGIGTAKAVTLLAALELGSRKMNTNSKEKVFIKDSRDAWEVMFPHTGDLEHEEFWILILNRAHKVINTQKISQGGLTGTVIDTRIILKYALDKKATSMIISHNHPSGNLKPSEADISITKKIKEAAEIMDIQLLDHIIIAGREYFSFADQGIL
ncbi:MAG: DNA repair protein RadC [Bacteroidales bacterium]|nr:DNA repair protein RadC [Bacteroidales bacterium]